MRRILSSLLTLLAVTQIQAQQQRAPKLVIFITVDQLRGDYIEYFQHTFGERGFKRLLAEGAVCHNVRFGFANLNQASAFATLFTGAYPSVHGITGLKTYSFETAKEVSQLYDADYLGNFTRDNYSPKNLLAATIGDELKIVSGGRSEVYAIAPDAEAAILSAGHAANGAFWIDNYNGRWATTTYYKGVPWYVEKYNALPCLSGPNTFQYTFKANTAGCYPDLKTSPFGNEEVSRLFNQFLEYGALGTRPTPDFVALTFYAGNYRGIRYSGNTREIQDLYHRLDKELERLIDAVEKKVGLQHVLFVLTGTGHFTSEEAPVGSAASSTPSVAWRC